MIIAPYIKQQFDGVIWRMEIDPLTSTLFLEIRNEEHKQVSFASVSLSTDKINFANLTVDERWLTGIESAYNGVLLLYAMESESSPAHRGLTAIDANTGDILWGNYNLTFNHLSNHGPVCFDHRIQPRKLFIIDVKTGERVRGYDAATDDDFTSQIMFPEMRSAQFLALDELPETPFGNIVHSLDHNGYRIVSLHAPKGQALNQLLYIFKDGRQLFSDLLASGIQKLQPEAFVMHNRHLVYLKNRVELNVINLEKTD